MVERVKLTEVDTNATVPLALMVPVAKVYMNYTLSEKNIFF